MEEFADLVSCWVPPFRFDGHESFWGMGTGVDVTIRPGTIAWSLSAGGSGADGYDTDLKREVLAITANPGPNLRLMKRRIRVSIEELRKLLRKLGFPSVEAQVHFIERHRIVRRPLQAHPDLTLDERTSLEPVLGELTQSADWSWGICPKCSQPLWIREGNTQACYYCRKAHGAARELAYPGRAE